jgi:adenylate kinase family enzyme
MTASELPARVWIVGPCGSGKSWLADRLAARAGVPAVHLDDLQHLPGWRQTPPDELRAKIDAATSGPAWVADGNYGTVVRELRARADLVVWLDLPFHVTFARVVSRTLRRAITRELCCNGNRESLVTAFFRRDSILLWAITTHRRTRRNLDRQVAAIPHVRLRTRRAVAEFVASEGCANSP